MVVAYIFYVLKSRVCLGVLAPKCQREVWGPGETLLKNKKMHINIVLQRSPALQFFKIPNTLVGIQPSTSPTTSGACFFFVTFHWRPLERKRFLRRFQVFFWGLPGAQNQWDQWSTNPKQKSSKINNKHQQTSMSLTSSSWSWWQRNNISSDLFLGSWNLQRTGEHGMKT